MSESNMSDELAREEFEAEQNRWIDEERERERVKQEAQTEWEKMPEHYRKNTGQYLPVLPNGEVNLEAFTCFGCPFNGTCEFRWDAWNTNGECLADK